MGATATITKESGVAPTVDDVTDKDAPLVSHTDHVLSRNRSFRYAADLTVAQNHMFVMCAGARRFMFNHHIGRVKENLDARRAEAAAEFCAALRDGREMALDNLVQWWTAVGFVLERNARTWFMVEFLQVWQALMSLRTPMQRTTCTSGDLACGSATRRTRMVVREPIR